MQDELSVCSDSSYTHSSTLSDTEKNSGALKNPLFSNKFFYNIFNMCLIPQISHFTLFVFQTKTKRISVFLSILKEMDGWSEAILVFFSLVKLM